MSEEIKKEEINENVGSGFMIVVNKQIHTVQRSNDKSNNPYLNSTEAYSIFNILSEAVEKTSESSDIIKGHSFICNKKFNLTIEIIHSDYFVSIIKNMDATQFKEEHLKMQNDMMNPYLGMK